MGYGIIRDVATSFTIVPRGAFSLRESAEFGFGQRHSQRFTGTMPLAFCLDSFDAQVGVELTQDDGAGGAVHGAIHGSADPAAVQRQVERVLSLDVDAAGFAEVGVRDPVIARLQGVAPGLRPPLFYSPYEAAIWSVLSARRPARQMAEVRLQLSLTHGRRFELGGETCAALPTPAQLLRVREFPGIAPDKIARMHGVAQAAVDGWLDIGRLRSLGPGAATSELQRMKGIGPFYASLIVIRAMGFTDVLPREEPLLRGLVGDLYGLGSVATPEQLTEIAQAWRPFRTWASVLVRAATSRLTEGADT